MEDLVTSLRTTINSADSMTSSDDVTVTMDMEGRLIIQDVVGNATSQLSITDFGITRGTCGTGTVADIDDHIQVTINQENTPTPTVSPTETLTITSTPTEIPTVTNTPTLGPNDPTCTPTPREVTYNNNENKEIPDFGNLTSTLNVFDFGVMRNIFARVLINHPNPGSLVVTLTSPDGVVVYLQYKGEGIWEYFDADLNNRNVLGNWTLEITDSEAGNSGTLENWSVTLGVASPEWTKGPFRF